MVLTECLEKSAQVVVGSGFKGKFFGILSDKEHHTDGESQNRDIFDTPSTHHGLLQVEQRLPKITETGSHCQDLTGSGSETTNLGF